MEDAVDQVEEALAALADGRHLRGDGDDDGGGGGGGGRHLLLLLLLELHVPLVQSVEAPKNDAEHLGSADLLERMGWNWWKGIAGWHRHWAGTGNGCSQHEDQTKRVRDGDQTKRVRDGDMISGKSLLSHLPPRKP